MALLVEPHLPALSEDGWVTDPLHKADYLFSHFFASNYSQSFVYANEVSSMAWVIHKTQGKVNDTITLLNNTLSKYFSRYFNNVTVEVNDIVPPGGVAGSTRVTLSIYVGITINGKEISLSRVMELTNSNTFRILNINNNG